MRRPALRSAAVWFALCCLATLAGCGFQLRGQAQLPFSAAYVQAANDSATAVALRQALSTQGRLATALDTAPVRITLANESRAKTILALSGGGKVREFRLEYRVYVSAMNATGQVTLPPVELSLYRDFSFSDAQVLAKEAEEAALWRSMTQEATRQILRRLAYLQP